MEEILSSIRRIIAEDEPGGQPSAGAAQPAADLTPAGLDPDDEDDDVLELTEVVGEPEPPPELHATFSVVPQVGPQTPTLRVTIEARSGQVTLPDLAGACFVAALLELQITDPKGKVLAIQGCESPATTATRAVADGMPWVIEIPLAEVVGSLRRGVYPIDVGWALSLPGTAQALRSSSLSTSSFAVAPLRAEVKVERDRTAKLPGGARLRLSGHSHKHMMAGDGESPLGISGEFAEPKGSFAPFDLWIHLGESRLFTLGNGHTFELVDHAYGESITVRYFGKLAL